MRRRFYGFDRQVEGEELEQRFGLRQEIRWERRGQWLEIYVPDPEAAPRRSKSARYSAPERATDSSRAGMNYGGRTNWSE
jgi:hypothetical protein